MSFAVSKSQTTETTQPLPMKNRLDDMLDRYGECCTQTKAGQILNKSVRTIHRMLEDGRLRRVGSDVDVRSMAHYLENPCQQDFAAREKCKRPPTLKHWDSFAIPPRANKR